MQVEKNCEQKLLLISFNSFIAIIATTILLAKCLKKKHCSILQDDFFFKKSHFKIISFNSNLKCFSYK